MFLNFALVNNPALEHCVSGEYVSNTLPRQNLLFGKILKIKFKYGV